MKKPSNKKKLLIFGNYGVPNFGDEAILAGLLCGINKNKWQVTVISVDPILTNDRFSVDAILSPPFGLRSLFKGGILRTLKAIISADLIIFGGGGLFQDYERGALIMWFFYLRICQFFNRHIALVANSIGPIRGKFSLFCIKKLFEKISFFSVRDQESGNFLMKIGVPKSKISISTDAVFLLKPKVDNVKKKKGILLIMHGKHTTRERIKEFKKFVHQKDFKKKITFLPMQIKITKDDLLAEKLGIKTLSPKSLKEVFEAIANAELVITSRLHGAILSMLFNTPFIIFSKLPKVKNFISSLHLDKLFLQSVTAKELNMLVKDIYKNMSKMKLLISKSAKNEKKKASLILPDFV